MPVADYVAEIRRRILDTPHVVSHSLGYEDRPPIGAIINGTVTFADGSCLYIKEFLLHRPNLIRLKYSYHYTSPTRSLMFRYDNARDPAARHLPTYPAHRHTADGLFPSSSPELASVLREAASYIRRSH
jgi:hypothetical protein